MAMPAEVIFLIYIYLSTPMIWALTILYPPPAPLQYDEPPGAFERRIPNLGYYLQVLSMWTASINFGWQISHLLGE